MGVITGNRSGEEDVKTSASPSSALAYVEDEGEDGKPNEEADLDEELGILNGESSGPGDA